MQYKTSQIRLIPAFPVRLETRANFSEIELREDIYKLALFIDGLE
jgi:hypothetical protein